jgi:hypothetical protein
MNEYKLNKYRNGNFILQNKHIYAQNKLEKIRDSLLNKYTLYGGAMTSKQPSLRVTTRDGLNNFISTQPDFLNSEELQRIITKITEYFKSDQGQQLLINNDTNTEFRSLIQTNDDLIKEFEKYRDINNAEYIGLENAPAVKEELLKIQKNLLILQIKIIFSKLRKIKKSNITPLLQGIEKEILLMTRYIDAQEKELNNVPVQPQEKELNNQLLQLEASGQQPLLSGQPQITEIKNSRKLSDDEQTSIDTAFTNYMGSIGIDTNNQSSNLDTPINSAKLQEFFTPAEKVLYNKILPNILKEAKPPIIEAELKVRNLANIKRTMKKTDITI